MPTPLAEIQGFPELIQKLKAIENDKEKKRAMVAALRRVAAGTVRAARGNVPQQLRKHLVIATRLKDKITPDKLKKSIGVITVRKGKAVEDPTVAVGPRAKGNNDGFFGHWAEEGVRVYQKGFKRKHTGGAYKSKAQAHNAKGVRYIKPGAFFMKRTYEQTKGQVTEETRQSVEKVIQKVINKYSTR